MAAAGAPSNKFSCPFCDKSYFNSNSLSQHKKRHHSGEQKVARLATGSGGKLKCGLCESSFGNRTEFCVHLNSEHNTPAQVVQQTFKDETAFSEWLKAEAENGSFEWIRAWGKKLANGQPGSRGFMCHRSGEFTSESTDTRAPRDRPSIKMGCQCSAFVNASVDRNTGEVLATYCLDHYKHDFPQRALHIPPGTREYIAQQILDGRDAHYILQKIQESAAGSTSLSKHQLTRPQDIRNVAEQMGLKVEQRAKRDEISVDVLVREKEEEMGKNSPFFRYKPLQPDGSFSLGIQTAFQAEMLRSLGNRRVVCVDSSYKVSHYSFLVSNVVVLDDNGNGCPVASYITHSESKEALQPFFAGLKDRVGPLEPEVLMSDDAPAFWNAWESVFDTQNTERWNCTWHTLKNFKNNARSGDNMIADKDLREFVIQITRDMLYAKTEEDFCALTVRLLTELKDNGEMAYYNYMQKHYLPEDRRYLWALYKRSEQLVNANMLCEAYHKLMKGDCGLKGKQNRRLDHLIDVLLKLADRCCFQYAQQSTDAKVAGCKRKRGLHTRHKNYLRMVENGLAKFEEVTEGVEWRVSSETNGDLTYTVKVRDSTCGCNLRCNWCRVCPDNFTCSCDDYLTYGRASACKHIHLISAQQQPEGTAAGTGDIPVDQQRPTIGPGVAAATLLPQPPQQNAIDTTSLRAEWQKIGEMIEQIKNPEALEAFTEKMKQVRHLATTLIEREVGEAPAARFEVTQKVHGAQNAEKQLRFPQRKKRQTPRAAKMTTADLHKMLEGVTEDHCAHCFRDNDTTDSEFIKWTQCDTCDLWFHDNCIEKTDDSFQCKICAKKNHKSSAESKVTQEGEQPKRRRQQSPNPRPDSTQAGPSGPRHKALRTEEESSSNVSPVGVPSARRFYKVPRCAEEQNEQNVSAPSGQCPELVPRVEKMVEAMRSALPDTKPRPEIAEPKDAIAVVEKPLSFPLHEQHAKLRLQLKCFTKIVNKLRKRDTGSADIEFFNKQAQLMATALKRVQLANADLVKNVWGKRVLCPEVKKAHAVLQKMQYFEGDDSGSKQEIVTSLAMGQELLRDPYGTWDAVEGKRLPPAVPWKLPSEFHDHAKFCTTPPPKLSDYFHADNSSGHCKTRDRDSKSTIEKRKDSDTPEAYQFGWFSKSDQQKDRKLENEWNQWRERENAERLQNERKREEERQDEQEQQRRDQERQIEADRRETEWRVREQQRQAERERQEEIAENRRRERERERLEAEAEVRRQQRCNAQQEREMAKREYLRAEQERREAMRAEAAAREQAAEKERWRECARSFAAQRRSNPIERDWAQSKRRFLDENVSCDPFTSLFSSRDRNDKATTSLFSSRERDDNESSFNPFASLFSSLLGV